MVGEEVVAMSVRIDGTGGRRIGGGGLDVGGARELVAHLPLNLEEGGAGHYDEYVATSNGMFVEYLSWANIG